MFRFAGLIVRAALLCAAAVAAFDLAGRMVHLNPGPVAPDGPLPLPVAPLLLPVVSGVALALVARRATLGGAGLAMTLFVSLFGTSTAIPVVFALALEKDLGIAHLDLLALTVAGAAQAMAVGFAGAFLFRPDAIGRVGCAAPQGWRHALAIPAYAAVLLAAVVIAAVLQPAVRALSPLVALPVLGSVTLAVVAAGMIATRVATFLVARMHGPAWSRALVLGLVLAALSAAPLLPPNGYLAWPARLALAIAIGGAGLLWGLFAGFLFSVPDAECDAWSDEAVGIDVDGDADLRRPA